MLCIGLFRQSHKVTNSSYQYRPSLIKSSGSHVETDIFTKPDYQCISAVMCSNIDVAKLTSVMGADFIIVPNPLALNKLPDDFPNVGWEYRAKISPDKFIISSRELRYY